MNDVIVAKELSKTFSEGSLHVEVLKDITVSIAEGETVAIIGSSGAGKSTLLQLLGGLDLPTKGEVWVDGQKMQSLSDEGRGRLRNKALGFVYQFHHLLPEFTAIENVAMPLMIAGVKRNTARQQSQQMLERVGLGQRLEHKPGELSGGERQRAAIARALINSPKCVLADEPTGNLDKHTAERVVDLMLELNSDLKTSLIVVTHDHELANRMSKIIRMVDGQLVDEASA